MTRALPNHRLDALRTYLLAVLQDLIARGMVRRQHGQSLDTILQREMLTVLREVQNDLVTLGGEFVEAGATKLEGLGLAGQILSGVLKTTFNSKKR